MRRTANSEEVITYFSQFLTEISSIITNIKHYMFELIEVKIPSGRGESVSDSMSSIVVSTHRTYQDLRKIESIVSGYTRSRKNRHFDKSMNSTSQSQKRSRSQEIPSYDYPTSTGSSTPNVKEIACISNKNITMRGKFIKEERKIDFSQKEGKEYSRSKVRWLEIEDKQDFVKEDKQESRLEDNGERQCTLREIDNTIENRLKQLFNKSQSRFKAINTRNKQCSDLLSQVKQELSAHF